MKRKNLIVFYIQLYSFKCFFIYKIKLSSMLNKVLQMYLLYGIKKRNLLSLTL